jgi:methyl-accepting chemotaxis protein
MDIAVSMLHEVSPVPHTSTDTVHNQAVLKLARSTIRLSQVAPRLSELATERQAEALRQAEQLRSSADLVRQMTSTLQHTMEQLKLSTGEIGELTSLINRIADETRMISINAGIVAARNTDDQGRAFAVLSKEIRLLSENTADATRDVRRKVVRLEDNTLRTVQTIGLDDGKGRDGDQPGLAHLLQQLESASASAARHVREAQELNVLGLNLRGLSEEMIGAVGAFRMDVHELIEKVVQDLRRSEKLQSCDGRMQVDALRDVLKRNRCVELAYVTDANGVQSLGNVSRSNLNVAYEGPGRARNWATRGWFIGAKKIRGVYLSPIYRSEATDEFCLTASASFNDTSGKLAGVVALDVNFREILGS